jgi:lipoic acid synthetase
MAKKMNLKYLVITSVDRDDLPDRGANQFADCIAETRKLCPDMGFEILVPDFRGAEQKALETLDPVRPFVFAHNVETVPALYPIARMGGNYKESLDLLAQAKKAWPEIITKSSLMLGLGETDEQLVQTMKDLRSVACDRLTIGQYLKPSKSSLDVIEYVTPERFTQWKDTALDLGFSWVISEPYARSSYFAEKENAR